jgi:hypothetical protein
VSNTEDLFNKHAVKIIFNHSQGSGCIVQSGCPDYSYVFTAKHCLANDEVCNKEDIRITRLESNSDEISLTIYDVYLHPDLDIAIVKIEKISDLHQTSVIQPEKGQSVEVYGYPFLLKDQPEPRQNLKCSISFRRDTYSEITSDKTLFTFEKSIPDTIKGFSGSGVFYEKNKTIYIVGIFTKLKAQDGAYNSFCAFHIGVFEQLITANKLSSLFLDNFSHITRDYSLINNVFSISFSHESEPYYLEREIDKLFNNYLNSSKNIWISGHAGVGKTLLIVRNLEPIKKNSIHIDLTCSQLISIEDYFEYINNELINQSNLVRISERINIYEKISDNLCQINFTNVETIIFVDEVPISDKEKFYKFLTGFIIISERYSNLVKSELQIQWIISTRIDPFYHLQTDENCLPNKQKAVKNFIFKNFDLWRADELVSLMNLLQTTLNFTLSNITLDKILEVSNGLPGRLKSTIERVLIENCSIEQAIEMIRSENN